MSHAKRVTEDMMPTIPQDELMWDEQGNPWIKEVPSDTTVSTGGVDMETTSPGEEERLASRMEQLTPRQRFVIECSWGIRCEDGDMLSFREIAALMGVDWTTVREHYHSAMRKLREVPPQ